MVFLKKVFLISTINIFPVQAVQIQLKKQTEFQNPLTYSPMMDVVVAILRNPT